MTSLDVSSITLWKCYHETGVLQWVCFTNPEPSSPEKQVMKQENYDEIFPL